MTLRMKLSIGILIVTLLTGIIALVTTCGGATLAFLNRTATPSGEVEEVIQAQDDRRRAEEDRRRAEEDRRRAEEDRRRTEAEERTAEKLEEFVNTIKESYETIADQTARDLGASGIEFEVEVVETNDGGYMMEFGYTLSIEESQIELLGARTAQINISDYPPGAYRIEETRNSNIVISTVKNLLGSLETATGASEMMNLEIIGTADGLAVREGATYNGDLGEVRDFPYYSLDSNRAQHMDLNRGDQLTNETIAFLRGYDALMILHDMQILRNVSLQLQTETTERIGGQHRSVILRIYLRKPPPLLRP